MLYSLLELLAKRFKLGLTARSLAEIFQNFRVVELRLRDKSSPLVRTLEDLREDQKIILKKMNLPSPLSFLNNISLS